MFALIADDTLYVKADAETAEIREAEMAPFHYQRQARPSPSPTAVPAEALDDRGDFFSAIGLGFAAALRGGKPTPAPQIPTTPTRLAANRPSPPE